LVASAILLRNREFRVDDVDHSQHFTGRVIVVNKADSSTTLVISRATGETETHIAWLHYFRLDGKSIKLQVHRLHRPLVIPRA
jgi:hypothetical protein